MEAPKRRPLLSPLLRTLLALWLLLLALLILPHSRVFEFDREHFALRRRSCFAGITYAQSLLHINSSEAEDFFEDRLGRPGRRDWRRVGQHSQSLLLGQGREESYAEAAQYRWLCQGLRQMCDFGTYGDFESMSGNPDESAMLALASNTGRVLDSEGAEAANQYLIFTYKSWLKRGGGIGAVDNGMLMQDLSAADVPSLEAFALRDGKEDSEPSGWWPRYPDLLTMQCRE
ncbi:hypothetical protein IT575_09340 [bacterium]|nr:hypothetical protein [bacterium]